LERLSRKAAADSLAAIGGHVREDDRFDALAVSLLGVGVRAWLEHDVGLAGGVSRETFAFRMMRGWRGGSFSNGPTIDWIRSSVRDSRFEPDVVTVLTHDGVVPEVATEGLGDFDGAVLDVSAGLSTRALWTLHHVARPRAEGDPLVVVARGLDMAVAEAGALLEALRVELGDAARARRARGDVSVVDVDPARVGVAA
jgi:hypothetical protein